MAPIKHFAAPAGLTTPPLSFATRVGDLLFVSGIPGFDDSGALPDSFEALIIGAGIVGSACARELACFLWAVATAD